MSQGPILPPVDRAALPPEVRSAGPERRREYQAALGFERTLVMELTKQLAQTAEGPGGGGAVPAAYRQLLPETMADALVAGGGLGLARALDQAMHPEPPAATRTGGAAAPTS